MNVLLILLVLALIAVQALIAALCFRRGSYWNTTRRYSPGSKIWSTDAETRGGFEELPDAKNSREEEKRQSRKDHNFGAICDWLDNGLEQYQPGNVNTEELQFSKKYRGEGRVLLKESQLKRLDNEGLIGEDDSHRLLLSLMVEPDSLLARRHPLYHHDMVLNIFGSPAGYQRLLRMEASEKPDTRERAANCRAGIERTVEALEEYKIKLAVPHVETPDDKEARKVDERHNKTRQLFTEALKDNSCAQALRETARLSGYSERQVYTIVSDL